MRDRKTGRHGATIIAIVAVAAAIAASPATASNGVIVSGPVVVKGICFAPDASWAEAD